MNIRDSQRSKVYDWERTTLPPGPDAEVEETLKLVDAIVRGYALNKVSVEWGLRGLAGRAYYSKIQLNNRGATRWVVCHEMAHVILTQKCDVAAHGPEFMRVYLDLLKRHMDISPARTGLKVAAKAKVPQPVRAVRERALKPKPTRCAKHRWQILEALSSKLTTKGMVVTHRVRCRGCLKVVPAPVVAKPFAKKRRRRVVSRRLVA